MNRRITLLISAGAAIVPTTPKVQGAKPCVLSIKYIKHNLETYWFTRFDFGGTNQGLKHTRIKGTRETPRTNKTRFENYIKPHVDDEI